MSAPEVETLLARLLADPSARSRFAGDPLGFALEAGLRDREARSFAALDLTDLELAGAGFDAKRRRRSFLSRWLRR